MQYVTLLNAANTTRVIRTVIEWLQSRNKQQCRGLFILAIHLYKNMRLKGERAWRHTNFHAKDMLTRIAGKQCTSLFEPFVGRIHMYVSRSGTTQTNVCDSLCLFVHSVYFLIWRYSVDDQLRLKVSYNGFLFVGMQPMVKHLKLSNAFFSLYPSIYLGYCKL